jgi:uncharacterized protein (TIGR02646 family)
MIAIQRTDEPEILKTQGKLASNALCVNCEHGHKFKDKDFKRSIYAHSSVKKALFNMQHGKCCFCESKTKNVAHLGSGDVEHFRPKAGYQQEKHDKISELGYYWLAYQWDNLLLSCESCNRLFKKNLFPLLDNQKRAKNHYDNIKDETPLLINPTEQNPEKYISFNEYVPYSIDDNSYGITTIKILNLTRTDLEEKRKKLLNEFNTQLFIIKKAANKIEDNDWQELAEEARQLINEMALPQAKYSAMIKAAINETGIFDKFNTPI